MTFRVIAKNLTFGVLRGITGASNRKARARPVNGVAHGLLRIVHSGNWGSGFRCGGKDGRSESTVGTFTSWARIVRPVAHIAKLIPHTTEGIVIECSRYQKDASSIHNNGKMKSTE